MFNVQHIKNIISENERIELVNWTVLNQDTDMFTWSPHPGCVRKTTRFSNEVKYPKVAFDIRKRIEDQFHLSSFIYPPFPQGMVASLGIENDECKIHRDYIWFDNTITYHCVILLSAPMEGAIPIINDKEYIMEEMDGLFYPVSELDHYTTKLIGSKPRIIWIFGFCVSGSNFVNNNKLPKIKY